MISYINSYSPANLQKLLEEGYNIECFIEGGRSRNGKMRYPKMGLLTYILKAFFNGSIGNLHFIPVSIDYEKIIESRSYTKELVGGKKEKEKIVDLLQMPKVLKSRYGRLYIQFGEPVNLLEFMDKQKNDTKGALPDTKIHELTKAIGMTVASRICNAATITPSALTGFALLSHMRRGVSKNLLTNRIGYILNFLIKKKRPTFGYHFYPAVN